MKAAYSEKDIETALQVLRKGGVILYPTDTVWGLGCDATNDEAVSRVFEIKQRPAKKTMIVLLASERDILKYVAAPPPDISPAGKLGKPVTVIYSGAMGISPLVADPAGSVAIRVVSEQFCSHLIKRLGKPLVSTSANFSGQPTPEIFTEIDPELIKKVDYTVSYRQHDETRASPSAIVKFDQQGNLEILRP